MSERGDIRASVSGRYSGESLQVGKRRAILSALVGHGMHRECNENRSRECREQHSELDYCKVRLSLTRRVTSKWENQLARPLYILPALQHASCHMARRVGRREGQGTPENDQRNSSAEGAMQNQEVWGYSAQMEHLKRPRVGYLIVGSNRSLKKEQVKI